MSNPFEPKPPGWSDLSLEEQGSYVDAQLFTALDRLRYPDEAAFPSPEETTHDH